jgi:3-hydroxybutyryl-CoA dehydrogenase
MTHQIDFMKTGIVGVVGAGNIGIGVATDLVLHGLNAVVVDISREQLKRAEAEVLKSIRFAPLLLKGAARLSKADALKRIAFTDNLKEVGDQEATV